jgi:ABC-type multidrug transport system ATPase subunit
MAGSSTIMADAVVDVAGLAKWLGGRAVVRGVTMRLVAGGMVGLVGANGGGKTTTLRMIAGLLRPDMGSGYVLSQAIGDRRSGQPGIGYMGQRLALYPDLTVSENLRFHRSVHGLSASAVGDCVARYGLSEVCNQRFDRLSGGWARRVHFAASVIHAPPLILLDEPTAGLDVATKAAIWDWLAALSAQGHAIVVSTHDLAEAERLPSVILYADGLAGPMTTVATVLRDTGQQTLEAAVQAMAAQ